MMRLMDMCPSIKYRSVGAAMCLAVVAAAVIPANVQAHGTHPNILSPLAGVPQVDVVEFHIEETHNDFPYVHIRILQAGSDTEVWSGLLPLGKAGYHEQVDLKGWQVGGYIAEVRFLGDLVEQIQKHFFIVGAP